MASSDSAAAAIPPLRGIIRGMGGARGSSWLSAATPRGGLARTAMLVILWTAGGCAPSENAGRAFGSRRVVQAREPALSLRAFTDDLSGLYLARFLDTQQAPDPLQPYDRSLLDLATGNERPIEQAVVWATILPGGAGGGGPFLAMSHHPVPVEGGAPTLTGEALERLTFSFLDEKTGERLDILDVLQINLLGATRSDPMALTRIDAAGAVTQWFGVPETLRQTPGGVLALDDSGAFVALATLENFGAPVIVHAPFDGSAPTEFIPFRLGDHRAIPDNGDAPLPPVEASGAKLTGSVFFSCPLPASGQPAPRCLMVIDRTLPDDSHRHFVRFLDDPRELQLPGETRAVASGFFARRDDTLVWMAPSGSTPGRLFTWRIGTDAAMGCSIPDTSVREFAWRRSDRTFAAITAIAIPTAGNDSGSEQPWHLVTSAVDGSCAIRASGTEGVSHLVFSPDGTILARLQTGPSGNSTIRVSAADGTGDRILAAGQDFTSISFLEDGRLLLRRTSGDGTGLSWLDPTAAPADEHPIAERTGRLPVTWLNSRWMLTTHSYSAQDDSSTLAVIDSRTGEERAISTAVIDFRVGWATAPAGATHLPVAYIVRGRVPSAQDGIWLASIPLADFPPDD